MEDLERYLDEIVDPTVLDLQSNPTSVRHAFLACVAVFHSIDYLAFPKKPQNIRSQFRSQSPDFALVDHVAHAFKHVVSKAREDRLNAKEVISRPPAYYESAIWDLSRWDDAVGGVTLTNERDVDILASIKRAIDFLRDKLKAR
jgi:hypothetical protein